MTTSQVPLNRRCANYGTDARPLVEILPPTAHFERDVSYTFMLYVLKGTVHISYGKTNTYTLNEGNLMLFPPGIKVSGRTCNLSQTMLLRVRDNLSLCDKYTLEMLYRDIDTTKIRHTHLESNMMVQMHMDLFAENICRGLQCVRYMEMKVMELFCYLRADYEKEELQGFNIPLLSADAQFMDFVWRNYRKAHNVSHFAKIANSSPSTFKMKFKKVTGIPASQWMMEQKARNVYHDICCGQKTLKEVSREYHFASDSHLGTFCRKHFGKSPKQLKNDMIIDALVPN